MAVVVAVALIIRRSKSFVCATSTLFIVLIVLIVLVVSFLIVFIVFLVTSVLLYRLRKV